jgi:plasmid stabilization system protein ParE
LGGCGAGEPRCAAANMSRLKLSARAVQDMQRLFEFLAQYDLDVAHRGNDAIYAALRSLSHQPNSGAPLEERRGVRKLVVDFGASGYLIFHRYRPSVDTVDVLTILHQKENYSALTVGRHV